MKKQLEGIAAGIVAAAKVSVTSPGGRFEVEGHRIICPLCRNDQFDSRKMLMNTRGLTLFDLDWLNDDATALVCRKCSRIELFAKPPRNC